jgi:hypothetical protein
LFDPEQSGGRAPKRWSNPYMEKQRSRSRRKKPPVREASLGLVWENLKFSLRALLKRRGSRKAPREADAPVAAPSKDSPG